MIRVGDKVKVKQIQDRGQAQPLVGKEGVVREFRVVDGSQVGYVVAFPDNTAQWFFASELEPA
ncbi:MAG: DUF2862 domain-containing protein [Thermostichales cyanobacterium SZTDM-1c_bins_54]